MQRCSDTAMLHDPANSDAAIQRYDDTAVQRHSEITTQRYGDTANSDAAIPSKTMEGVTKMQP